MKIGNVTLHWPWHQETISALDIGYAKSLFPIGKGTSYKPKDLASNFEAYENSDLIRAPIDDLVESACGNGYYNTVEKTTPILEKSKPRDLVDAFGEFFGLDSMLNNITRLAVIAGFCPVQTKLVQDVEKCALKIVHPLTVSNIVTDPISGEVLKIEQKVGNDKVTIPGTELAWFTYCKIGNDPRGLSLVQGITGLLNNLNKANDNVGLILDRYIAPIGIWKSKQTVAALKAAVLNRGAGEDIFFGNLTDEEITQKIAEFISIDPRVPFWEYIQDMKTQIFAYMRASNLWYEKDATLASDTALEQIIGRHTRAVQRDIKRGVEKYWYKPLIKLNLGEESEVPRLQWGTEPTGVEDIQPSEIISTGLNLGYISQNQYFAILKQIGIKVPEETKEEQEATELAQAIEEKPVEEPPVEKELESEDKANLDKDLTKTKEEKK